MILGLEWSQIFDVVSLRKMHFALGLHTFPVLIEQVPNLMKDYDLSLIQFQTWLTDKCTYLAVYSLLSIYKIFSHRQTIFLRTPML